MEVILPVKMLVWSFLLVVIAVSGDGKVLRDTLETDLFTASITCSSSYQTTDEVECEFTLENNGDGTYSVLKTNTPLNQLEPEGLVVTRDGDELDYNGPMMKREAPPSDEFKILGAGDSVSSKVHLSLGYDTSEPGTYTVAVEDYLEYVEGNASSMSADEIQDNLKLAHISSSANSFVVVE